MQRQLVPFSVSEINQRVAIRALAVACALHFNDRPNVAATGTDRQRLQRWIAGAGIGSGSTRGILKRGSLQVRR